MQDHKSYLTQNSVKIKEEGILNKESIDFYTEIFGHQLLYYSMWNELKPFPIVETGKSKGPYLKSVHMEGPALQLLRESCTGLCSIVRKFNQGLELSHMLDIINSAEDSVEKITQALLIKDTEKLESLSGLSRIGFEEFIFIVINWLKPLFISIREKNTGSGFEKYRGKSCPFCGYYPDMSLFAAGKESKRYLHCILCENVWLYKKFSCAICGNENKKYLEYFTHDDNGRYRIDLCHNCNGYIKTVCLSSQEEIDSCDLTVENLLTLSYDAELINKGFQKI